MAALSSSTILLGQSERDYILAGCRQDCRLDGRTCHQVRPYVLVQQEENDAASPLILSHGSARLMSANSSHDGESTQLLCSVKAELVQPAQRAATRGVVEYHVDTLAVGISRRQCDDLQATLTHLLGDQVVDTAALCVMQGQYAWRLQVDLYILSTAGSLLDAAARVIRQALQTTQLPALEVVLPAENITMTETESTTAAAATVIVDADYHHASPVPGVDAGPLIVTVTVLQSAATGNNSRPVTSLLLDATAAEEACAAAQVHVSVIVDNAAPTISAVRKTGTGSLPVALLPEITKLALQQASKLGTKDDPYVRKMSREPATAWLLQGLYEMQ